MIGQRLEGIDAVKVVTDFFDSLPADFDADRIADLIGTTGLVVLVLIVLFAVLNDGPTLVGRVRRLVPPEHRDRADEVGRIARRSVGRYFAGSLRLSLLSGLVILSAGLILRVPLAPLAGIWVAITNLIPQVGGFLGGSFFVILAFSESPVIGVLALVVFLTWQNIENHILHPTIIGKAVNLSPPTTMIAALIGATAAGVPGAILATPLLGAAKSVWQDTVGRRQVDDEPPAPETVARRNSRRRRSSRRCRNLTGWSHSARPATLPPVRLQRHDRRSSADGEEALATDRRERASTQGDGASEEKILGYRRSSVDLLRLFTYLLISAASVVAVLALDDSVVRLEGDLVSLVDRLSTTIARIVHGLLEWIVFVTIVAFLLLPVVTRRYRLFGYVIAGSIVAATMMAGTLALLDRSEARDLLEDVLERDELTAAVTFGPVGVAVLVAGFVTLAPFVTSQWRHAGRIGVAALVVVRLVTVSNLPGNVLIALPIGAAAGTAVLWALGRPQRRPSNNAIRTVLREQAVPVRDVSILDDATGGTTRGQASLDDGRVLDVKVEGDESRAVDLMTRLHRWAMYRDGGLDRPFSSLRRNVEHQALMSFVCVDAGVRTPRVRTVAPVGLGAMLIAHESVQTVALDDAEQPLDTVVAEMLRQVSLLHDQRIAHRDLSADKIRIGADGDVWLVGFERAELAADDALLANDTAAMLVIAAALIGSSRTTALAVDTLGSDAVARALPRLQPAALGPSTRRALKQHPALLDDLRDEMQAQTGIEEFELDQLDRVDRQTVFTAVVLVAAVYFLLPQFANLPSMFSRLESANWWWAALVVVATAATFVGSSLALAGAVTVRLRPVPLLVSQIASSFAKTLGPGGVGAMALNVRFLRRQGIDRPVAVAGVGLRTVAGVVVHLSLLVVFVVWARQSAFAGLRLPDPEWLLVGLAAVVVCAVIALLVPQTRQLLATRLWPTIRRAFDGLSAVLRRPDRVALLAGGWATVTGLNLLSLYFAVEALGGGLSLATVGAVYLVGAIVATFAPTPGGIGAIEAALISGLVAAGLANSAAVPAVILFRLLTFWLPILPGWFGLRWLQNHDDL